nr:MAG TPA: hypothetical protein [Caudoviricetes sp.]
MAALHSLKHPPPIANAHAYTRASGVFRFLPSPLHPPSNQQVSLVVAYFWYLAKVQTKGLSSK